MPQPVVPDRRDDEPGHAGRKVLLLDHNQPRGLDLRERRLRRALAVAEQLVRTVDRYPLEKIGDAREAGVFPALPQQGELRPVLGEFVDLAMIELYRADGLRRREEPPAFRAQPRVCRKRAMLVEPNGDG